MTSIIKVDTIQTASGGTPTASSLGIGALGKIGQVVISNFNTGNVQTTSNSFVATGHIASITPSSTSSKVLVSLNMGDGYMSETTGNLGVRVHCNSSGSYVGVSNDFTASGLVDSNYILHGKGGNNFINPNGAFSVHDASMDTGMIIGCAFTHNASSNQLKVSKLAPLAIQDTCTELRHDFE